VISIAHNRATEGRTDRDASAGWTLGGDSSAGVRRQATGLPQVTRAFLSLSG
jgi:hypothetical protein